MKINDIEIVMREILDQKRNIYLQLSLLNDRMLVTQNPTSLRMRLEGAINDLDSLERELRYRNIEEFVDLLNARLRAMNKTAELTGTYTKYAQETYQYFLDMIGGK